MDRDERTGSDVGKRSDGVGGIVVVRLHEPARFVGSNADEEVVDLRECVAGLAIVTAVAAVSAEVDAGFSAFDHESTPKTLVRIEQASA